MNKFVLLSMLSTLFLLASCASGPKPREATRDYKVVDFSNAIKPEWIEQPSKGDSSKELKKNRYFISESEHKNKRLCLKSAEARATATVASEISQFIKNTYGESTSADDEEVSDYMTESLAQETQAFVIGAQVHKTYWELRSYQKELGAKKDYKKYACYALIKMNKKALKKAIDNSTAELYKSIKDPEVKEKTKQILKDVADKFNEAKK